MAARRKRKEPTKHRLLVYERLSKRWRPVPLLVVFLGSILYGLVRFGISSSFMGYERFILGLIVVNIMFYILLVIVGSSYVEAQPKVLYVRAGLIALNISYRRILSIYPASLSRQYPFESLSQWERTLLEPVMNVSSTAVELRGFPLNERWLRRLWTKFLFLRGRKGLIFTVRNSLLLNQQIEHLRDRYLERREKRRQRDQGDIFERVAAQQERRLP